MTAKAKQEMQDLLFEIEINIAILSVYNKQVPEGNIQQMCFEKWHNLNRTGLVYQDAVSKINTED